jgi:hypothetical protein
VGGTPDTHEAHDRWDILSACESVTVPAGTFTAILHPEGQRDGRLDEDVLVRARDRQGQGVGGQLEELVSYSLVP